MLFICAEDFFNKALTAKRLSRQEEEDIFARMRAGDTVAREQMIEGYLAVVAARIKRLPKDMQSLDLIYSCMQALERAVDQFDFSQEGEPFTHRLGLLIKRELTRSIAKN